MPQGTGKSHQKEYAESSVQNVHGGIFVSVQDESTDRANMGAHRQALLDPCTTGGTILRGELWGDGNDGDLMQVPIVLHPLQEGAPTGIADTLREMTVAHQIADLQVFIGKEIAR